MLVAVLLATGCADEEVNEALIYAEGEQAALARFRAIQVGQSEQELISILGPPSAIVERREAGALSARIETESGVDQRTLDGNRAAWPYPLFALPDRAIQSRVLVYADGTVFAFHYIDASGRIEHRDELVS